MITREDLNGGLVDARLTLRAIAGSLESVAQAFTGGYAAECARLDKERGGRYGETFGDYAHMLRGTLYQLEADFTAGARKKP